ncbi:hypothetical protein AB0I28_10125 [Phytomonospora sp. NPDC050363]|uniref:hypothetical protein n=1 Tax=Phytomonospora sp. NPDC050363 TaxID=3155642 RepID=UPI0033FEF2C2
MKKIIRRSVTALVIGAMAFYLWYGLTGQGETEYSTVENWLGVTAIIPPLALTAFIIAFVLTGDSVMTALTGKNSPEFRDAPVGMGTVLSAGPTGTEVNGQPEIRLELEVVGGRGEIFRSQAKAILPVTQLAMLQPGAMIPVRYVPGRTDKVELDRSGDQHLARTAMEQLALRQGTVTEEALHIARTGIPARGVVTSLTVPGQMRDGKPKLILDVVITRPDGTTFEVRKEPFVPPAAVARLQVGSVVDVHYLPHDESRSAISVVA